MFVSFFCFSPIDYKETVQAGIDASAPSAAAKSSLFAKEQNKKHAILNGRPFEKKGPSVLLFYPAFGEFIRDKENQNLAIADGYYGIVEELMWAASEFYEDENERTKTIRN